MITITTVPAAAASAVTQRLAVRIGVGLNKPYCVGSVEPVGNVSFGVGRVRVVDGVAIATITARGTVVFQPSGSCKGGEVKPFAEHFTVAFVATGTNTITVAAGDDVVGDPYNVRCCKAYGYAMNTTITVSIA
jgi:hypothetical protein